MNQSLMLTGGTRVVFEHASRLSRRGHDVLLLAPKPTLPGLSNWRRWAYERWSGRVEDGIRSYGLLDRVVRFDPSRLDSVPDGDVTVATAWVTAEWVDAMPARAGRKYYLIQGYEAWSPELESRVDRTWKLPLRKIVIAGWLERLGRERFGEVIWARIPNGVDLERFRPSIRDGRGPVVGMLYDLAPWKGGPDGIAALWKIHEAHPKTRFLVFGRYRLRHRLPPGAEYVRDPMQSELSRLYARMDVFLSSSHSEGFSLVLLEALACGCAVVATAVGEAPEMGRPGEEYLLVPARDPDALARQASALVADDARRRRLADAGLALAARFDWERATDDLERALFAETA